MEGFIKTLVLEANGFGWRPVLVDTFIRGVLGIQDINYLPKGLQRNRIAKRALKYHYERLSYAIDWRDAICESPNLDVTVCNINDLTAYSRCMKAIKDFELIIVLHSATGDDMTILLATAKRYLDRKGKLVVFIGNEYDLLADKINFLRQTKAEFVCSQLPIQSARWLYSECPETRVLEMPHALNPDLYKPTIPDNRKIDLGFRGLAYPIFIGDVERQVMLNYFSAHSSDLGLNVDIRYEKVDRREWATYLQSCRGIIGAEAGTYFLNKGGMSISLAKKYLRKHPQVTLKEIQTLFFEKSGPYISGKAISSRHFEAIGTKTCQVLLEGNYNEILKPDIHYISLKKDFSNIKDVVDRFRDDAFRHAMVERTYEYVANAHTYRHRVEYLINSVAN